MKKMVDNCGDLKNYWYAAALAKELKKKPIGRTVLEVLVVLWRTADGRAHAMRDRCPHRNALLSEGNVVNDNLMCPYHGWTFNTEGKCVKVPSEGDNANLRERHIDHYAVIEQDGLIWIWLGDLSLHETRQPFKMPFYSGDGWNSYYMKTRFQNNVTNLVENFMDVPHTVWVHKGWFRDKESLKVNAIVSRDEGAVTVKYDGDDQIGVTDLLMNPKRLPMVHHDRFFMPNNTSCDYIYGDYVTGFVITSTCTPMGPFETEVYTLISYKFGWLNHIGRWILPWYTRQVINQDVEIMANQGRSLQDMPADFKSTPADTLHLFIESLRQSAENSEHEKPRSVTKDIEFWI